MKRALFTILATAAALSVTTASAETVQIANAADWATFANRVNAGETTLNAEMTANVMLVQNSPRVGTDGNPYGGAFDGLGHRLTLNWNLPGVDFATQRERVSALLEAVRERGMSLEINTSGVPLRGSPYPADWIVRAAIGMGIPLVPGSDAHAPEDVGRHFDSLPGLLAGLAG